MFQVVDAAFSMLVDLYRQSDVQDPNTGAIKKEWSYYRTMSCYAKGVISNTATARSGDRQTMSNRYENTQILEIRTTEKLSMRDKITNIRNQQGQAIWTELDFPSETPTVFEVVGSTPMTDPFGDVLAWNSVVKRSENQQIGL
jgi:hypothetical protein